MRFFAFCLYVTVTFVAGTCFAGLFRPDAFPDYWELVALCGGVVGAGTGLVTFDVLWRRRHALRNAQQLAWFSRWISGTTIGMSAFVTIGLAMFSPRWDSKIWSFAASTMGFTWFVTIIGIVPAVSALCRCRDRNTYLTLTLSLFAGLFVFACIVVGAFLHLALHPI